MPAASIISTPPSLETCNEASQIVRAEDVSPRVLRTALALAISLFFIWGLAYGLLDVLNKHFQDTLHVGTAESTWLQIAYFGAYLVVSLPAGLLLQRLGYKAGILIGLAVTAAGALLFIPAAAIGQFAPFVGSMFVLASGLACLGNGGGQLCQRARARRGRIRGA